ncbi:MAG: BMC domain-containing protein [Candidatus Borkfalkiaceae bacterium]|nr:BMC domain-containing protein [Clostridia bacterium]MDY6223449.1 BMC domain-containing protein [Christensenellaceae bacterium]
MFKAIGVIELKSIPKGVEAADAALKSAGVEMVAAHPACPGKYEIILTGSISNVTASVEHVKGKFENYIIDSSVMGRIDEQVITALFGTQKSEKKGALGLIETFSAATTIKAADIAVKTARVDVFDLRVSRGIGGKGVVMITGEIGDVTAAIEAGSAYAKTSGQLSSYSIIAAPHEDLWNQL